MYQMCLEEHFLNEESRCPNVECGKDIETTLLPSETELQEDLMQISPQMTEASRGKYISLTRDERIKDLPLFESNADIGLIQALQNKDASSLAKNAIEPTSEICSKCSEAISPELSKPVVLLTCKHVIHFECIGNKRNLCPKCPSADDLEKEGYYISSGISINEAPKKKRKKPEDNTHENKPKKISKPQAMIRELSVVPISDEASITIPPEDSNVEGISNKFHRLYCKVDIIEKKGDRTNREVIHYYFRFGKALSEHLTVLLKSKPPQTAYTDLNSEVKKHLPKNLNNAMIRKRTDTARKIYDVFSKLGENKIQRVKSFRSEVKYIMENFPSNKQ